jgi:hypothetical protein
LRSNPSEESGDPRTAGHAEPVDQPLVDAAPQQAARHADDRLDHRRVVDLVDVIPVGEHFLDAFVGWRLALGDEPRGLEDDDRGHDAGDRDEDGESNEAILEAR